MKGQDQNPAVDSTWARGLFERGSAAPPKDRVESVTGHAPHTAGGAGALWTQRLFHGQTPTPPPGARMQILRDGISCQEIDLASLKPETVIGRHPQADIQLEAQRLAMFHACLWQFDDECYIENLDQRYGALLNRKRLKLKHPVRLRNGALVDLPGHQLLFCLPDSLEPVEDGAGLEDVEVIPDFFHTPVARTPAPCPLLSHLVESRDHLSLWTGGEATLKVVDIIEETEDCKTFRLVGEPSLWFSYRPGQFVTLRLEIEGQDVQRSYSLSSSPSRPHTLDLTVKRVPDGLVSNWLCDRVRLGDALRVRGPAGKFTCFDYPSDKLLFVVAGSGITPVMSMCRWIVDTAARVDMKLLASFRSPPDILFRRELEWMTTRHAGLQVALTVTSHWRGNEGWAGYTGRVNREMLRLLAPDIQDRHIFLCGPEPFMASVKDMLRELDCDLSRLHTESFGGGRVARGSAPGAAALKLSGSLHQVRFTQSGRTVTVDERTSLLELAEAHGIEIDYSCRAGSCGDCMVKCRGDVELGPGCEIPADERAAGWVYACSCAARSDLEIDA